MEKPGGCWAYLPVSDHNGWPLCNTLAQIFPKNDDSVANWPCHTLWHRHVCGILLNEVIFLTANHCGPLPVRKLHSTGETIVWRDPGGSWACLRPVSDYERTCTFRGCRWHVQTYMSVAFLWSRSFFLRWITADPSPWGNFTPPTKQYCGETLGDLGPVYDPFPITSELTLPEAVGDTYEHICLWRLCEVGHLKIIFFTMNHWGPLPLRELHSTDETIAWRDPGGSWACLRPVSDSEWIHPSRGCRWHRHTCMWHPCEAGHFSYGESPWTPPLEGTSLHRWHNSVERPWGILSLFMTCF